MVHEPKEGLRTRGRREVDGEEKVEELYGWLKVRLGNLLNDADR